MVLLRRTTAGELERFETVLNGVPKRRALMVLRSRVPGMLLLLMLLMLSARLVILRLRLTPLRLRLRLSKCGKEVQPRFPPGVLGSLRKCDSLQPKDDGHA
jgi:hypothetical protein